MSFSNLSSPSAFLRVCVDQSDGSRISGRVYSQRLTHPMAFSDIGSLVLRLDEVLEKQNFPQAFQRSRTFREREIHVPAAGDPEEGIPLCLRRSGYLHAVYSIPAQRFLAGLGGLDGRLPQAAVCQRAGAHPYGGGALSLRPSPCTAPCRTQRGRASFYYSALNNGTESF